MATAMATTMAILTIWRKEVSNENTALKSAFAKGRGKIRAEGSFSDTNYDEPYGDEHDESYYSLDKSSSSTTKADKKSSHQKKKIEAAKKFEEDRIRFEEEKRKFESSNDSLTEILSQQVEIDRMNAETKLINIFNTSY